MEYDFVYKKFEDKYTKKREDTFLDNYKECKKKNQIIVLLYNSHNNSKKYEEMLMVDPSLYLPFYYKNVKVVLI